MEKVQIRSLLNKIVRCVNEGELAGVYLLDDGRFLKVFDIQILLILKSVGVDIEGKIIDSDKRVLPKEFIKPEIAVYDCEYFAGFVTSSAKGIDYNIWDQRLTIEERGNLFLYADIYSKLERIVRSTPDIVYPDICTCDNIYVDVNNGNEIQLIDYDGLQVGEYASANLSTTLGHSAQYLSSKKYSDGVLFNKELDKKSLILLYFLTTFNVNLNKVGRCFVSATERTLTLEDIFQCINLQDYDMMQKVWKIFNDEEQNEYLGESVFRLAEEYEMQVFPIPGNSRDYIKKLVKRR